VGGEAIGTQNCSRRRARHREIPLVRLASATRSLEGRNRVLDWIAERRWRCDGRFMCAPIEGRSGPVGAHPRRGHCSNAGWLSAVRRYQLYTIARSRVFSDHPGVRGARGI